MKDKSVYLAVDLGAGSGRVIAGEFDGVSICLNEIVRFKNTPIELSTGWHWDINCLYENILDGISSAADRYGDSIISIGIDTWGVDYGLLGKDGKLLDQPFQYRDKRTEGMMKFAFEKVDKRKIYNRTGIQFMFFNTIYQLLAEVASGKLINQAEDLLFTPDLIGYLLTGNKCQERTIASTTQLYNPLIKNWDYNLIDELGLPKRLFKDIHDSGTKLGGLKHSIASKNRLSNVKVITIAGHDTACAVAAVPSKTSAPVFLSSGTWSLMGIELQEPVINTSSFEDGFTNEVGIDGTTRFLKNISGLWLIQECRREWSERGIDIAYNDMARIACSAVEFSSLIDPDDERFISAGNMVKKIQDFCRETKQVVPKEKSEIIRCIYESLALRYAEVWKKLIQITGQSPTELHIVGGGCQDRLLNQFTANAIGANVIVGPVEATGMGNILCQLISDKKINGVSEARQISLNSHTVKVFKAKEKQKWTMAKRKFTKLTRTYTQ
ncbi:MAG: rhamnulokinase [Saprospiraceae bacterium]|nr:rhamnulokinase [Saprospiraceae bacterium]